MTRPAATGDGGLREALAALTGYPADSRTVQAFMEVYRDYAERQATARAAEELEAAAEEIGAVNRIVGSPAPLVAVLRARAAARKGTQPVPPWPREVAA